MRDSRFAVDTRIFLARKASRLMHHVADGTLMDALKTRWTSHKATRLQGKLDKQWRELEGRGKERAIKLENGLKLYVYPHDQLSELVFKGTFEQNERAFVRDLLRRGDTFVDVGANIGLFTITAASVVGKEGRVFAFEPTSITYIRLEKSVQLNRLSNVSCVRMALSDRTELRNLITSLDGYAAWNSFAQPTAGTSLGSEEVECVTWDGFAAQHHLDSSVTLVKIDIEGWELNALKGAQNSLIRADAPDLLIEFTEVNARAAGTSCANIYSYLLELGYHVYGFDAMQKRLWLDPPRQDYPYVNLLATKRVKWVANRLGYSIVDALDNNNPQTHYPT